MNWLKYIGMWVFMSTTHAKCYALTVLFTRRHIFLKSGEADLLNQNIKLVAAG